MWLSLLLIFFGLLFFYLRKTYSYWRERGVPGPNPIWFVGNCGPVILGQKSLHDIYLEIYRKYEGYPFVGVYRMLTPVLIIREPEMVKKIMVNDFRSFAGNDFEIDQTIDRLFGRNPFVIKGLEWKIRRSQLTTLLTSGKMKTMFPILDEVSNRMMTYIREKCSKGNNTLEGRDLFIRFTLDNIAASTMGIEGNCFSEHSSAFKQFGEEFVSPESSNSFKSYIVFTFPFIGNIFRLKFLSTKMEDQLIHMIRDILEHRRKNNIVRDDFLESIERLCKSSQYNDEVDIAAQMATFILDAYETSALVLSFTLFRLAAHPQCQSKLREEIYRYSEKCGGKLDYDTLHEMPYLQACIDEAMRMTPILRQFVKVCTQQYKYTCTDSEFQNLTINIEPETSIVIPMESLQNDAKYFESPDKYIPERFFNKTEYNKTCFLPFGEGHRICIGMRFGLAQVKLGIAQVIRHFEVTVNNKTKMPLEYDKWYFLMCPIGGLWMDFKEVKRS